MTNLNINPNYQINASTLPGLFTGLKQITCV